MIVTRFAPSPTGELHLGHVASALFAWQRARDEGGTFLLRIEDIDPVRCKPVFTEQIKEDLTWLGLTWDGPVRVQSEHMDDYKKALDQLREQDLIYPCFCTRKEIALEVEQAAHAPHMAEEGPDGPFYPGTCRELTQEQKEAAIKAGRVPVWRLDMLKAVQIAGPLSWHNEATGEQIVAEPELFGDVVLARKDVPTSYHLSVVVDDALQGVTLVTRGEDLAKATHVHRLLQALLGLASPSYHHHPLIVDSAGKRLSKRDKSVSIRHLRQEGKTAEEILGMAR